VDKLSLAQTTEVQQQMARREVKVSFDHHSIRTQPVDRQEMELRAPAVRKAIVRSRLEQLTDIQREKYVVDNVEQREQLAEDLQYLVGRTYFDEVESVLHDEAHKAVIAYRRSLDGRNHKFDDSPFLVYGNGGVLQLCELWGIDDGQGGIRWPVSEAEWSDAQLQDEEVQSKLSQCVESETPYDVGHGQGRSLSVIPKA
jgi:hypothetical protein